MLAELQDHPHARVVLEPALRPGGRPSHAYLFHGPGGAGKRAAARRMAELLLSEGSPDPEGARARVRSGTHPDLTWVTPSGAHEMLVSDIDGPVVAAATKTPFESERRVFVIEGADQLGDEAANRMLKTLEEPARFVHLVLISERLMDVLPTIRSRCQLVRFDPRPPQEVAQRLERQGVATASAVACARLALGDAGQAGRLAEPLGRALRDVAQDFVAAAAAGQAAAQRPWAELLAAARRRGEEVKDELEERLAEELKLYPAKERKRVESDWGDRIKRSRRRAERGMLDLGLQLVSLWLEDLLLLELGAGEELRNEDRRAALEAQVGAPRGSLLQAIDTVEETRSRFALNVSEELACEALAYRLERLLAG